MSNELATRNGHGAVLERIRPAAEREFVMLDRFSDNGLADEENYERVNAIATISAGMKSADGKPVRSRDGEIFIHGEAPALEAALAARGGKGLTVMFGSDTIADIVQNHFVCYSATKLELYGDEHEITWFGPQERRTFSAGSDNYKKALAKCKVTISIYFMLAEWNEKTGMADYVFDDGLGLYRLRFTSMNSLRSILSSLKLVRKMTHGRIAGIPFDLTVREEEHADPTGVKRRVPIWQCRPMTPPDMRLTPAVFRSLMESGLAQREMMALPAAPIETEIDAARDAEFDDDVAAFDGDGYCDAEYFRKHWFAAVDGSGLDNDAARATFISQFTDGAETSLARFLERATNEEATALIEAAIEAAPTWPRPSDGPSLPGLETEATASTPPDAEPAPENEISVAKRRWESLLVEGRRYNVVPTKQLPADAPLGQVRTWCDALDAKIVEARTKAMAATGNGPFDEPGDGETVEAEIVDEDRAETPVPEATGEPLTPLSQAIRDRAAPVSDPEGEALFNREDDAPAPPVSPADSNEKPKRDRLTAHEEKPDALGSHTQTLLKGLAKQGFDAQGDLGCQPIIDAANHWYLMSNESTRIESLDQMPVSDVTKFLRGLANKTIKVDWSEMVA